MTTATKPDPRCGEVWLVDFDPSVGQEQRKVRPAAVLNPRQVGRLDLRIVVPITSHKAGRDDIPWLVPLAKSSASGLTTDGHADTFQLKSLSLERFRRKLGELSGDELLEITTGIALCVGYSPT